MGYLNLFHTGSVGAFFGFVLKVFSASVTLNTHNRFIMRGLNPFFCQMSKCKVLELLHVLHLLFPLLFFFVFVLLFRLSLLSCAHLSIYIPILQLHRIEDVYGFFSIITRRIRSITYQCAGDIFLSILGDQFLY